MDVFDLREQLIDDYRSYVTSFMAIRDVRIREQVDASLAAGLLWPEPRIGLNPAFEPGGWVADLVAEELLHKECERIFRADKSAADPTGRPIRLHRHQVDAIREASAGLNYVLTTGTGSGKSLAYIVPIVDHVLRRGSGRGIQAIVVYPMNALANSQANELEKFLCAGYPAGQAPVTFRRYTGQEKDEERREILANPPDIILTNYVMLELILTRVRDRKLVDAAKGLKFLVLDELHTYRGRQGADVALLVRRVREGCQAADLQCVGTSATLATGGTFEEERAEIARVAGLLFGTMVAPSSVIGETLRRATPAGVGAGRVDVVLAELRERVSSAAAPSADYNAFVTDPLSAWIESTFGIEEREGRLVRVAPIPIGGPDGAAAKLQGLTGAEASRCAEAIQRQLLAGYAARHPETDFPAFAFRLHQFISKGDTVYTSVEGEAARYLTLHGQKFVPDDRSKTLLPLCFCRECGQEYYTVARIADDEGDGTRFVPRDLGERAGDDDRLAGFLYVSSTDPWPSDPDAVNERLPEDWLEEHKDVVRLKRDYRKNLPVELWVDPSGRVGGGGTRAWFVPAPFRFCLHCGVTWGGRTTRDFSKLATLGSEGRSTATTILALSAVRALRSNDTLKPKARKLLSFTDNRQDASLQAGHFNDFVQVGQLRAALLRAVLPNKEGIEHDELTQAVFRALDLPFDLYAVDPELRFAAQTNTDKALRDVLGYRLYLDLRRGWRVTSPNLEQCGLLVIDYQSLDDLCAAEDLFETRHPALAKATPRTRAAVAQTLLDFLRRELCVKVDYLDRGFQEKLAARSGQHLVGVWALDDEERLEYASVVYPRSRRKGDDREVTYLSGRSGFGQYLRRISTFPDHSGKLSVVDSEAIIADLLIALSKGGLVEAVHEASDGTKGYQVPAAALRWVAGDGQAPAPDPIRTPRASAAERTPNSFFVNLYRHLAPDSAGIEAREHTAQVPYDLREEREGRFREATLPVLFCSPTMELGVDISELNVVNLRNVPPTPANYAQRSGRAGRSGQPALVFTYCAAGSPHDQYFFRRPQLMVSGQVTPPRLELANEDLVRAHVQALWLSASGLDLGGSLRDVLDVGEGIVDAPLQDWVRDDLARLEPKAKARRLAERVLADIQPELEASTWWTPDWLDDVLAGVPASFEAACARWRGLFRAAHAQFDAQTRIIKDASRTSGDKNQAKRLRREAEAQLDLLTADADRRSQSDFYSYRYFASEGFLPGYSFPRLPLSAFIPGRRGRKDNDGEFVSRPRFLAIAEFGPRSLVYHEGSRYLVNRVILPVAGHTDADEPVLTSEAKRCESCGYLHPIGAEDNPDVCVGCGAELGAPLRSLFRLQNVSTQRRERINSDEEERQRQGYEIRTGMRFAQRLGRLSARRAVAERDGQPLATLTYGDTANLWRINVGRRRRRRPDELGYVLDVERGYWAKSEEEDATDDETPADPMSPRKERVVPYVEDDRNCLLFELAQRPSAEELASLQAALKAGIQVTFQLEDGELAAEPLPSADDRRLLMFYESAEGGAGVLRRLIDEPGALSRVAARALELCHFDPATGEDRRHAPNATEACEAACYDCLMSYRNQPDHPLLDRQVVLPLLRDLAAATVKGAPTLASRATHAELLDRTAESKLEGRWVEFITTGGFRQPDRAGVLVPEAGTRPDFVYDDPPGAIYVDGPPHDYPERQRRDEGTTARMRDLGYTVIRFGHADDWAGLVDSYRWVFGPGTADAHQVEAR